ncbi:hypothetical protein L6164_015532 [Bauhinia variegata]|uniref:Uncharacterized protein n=1 Tax=Bauhinia variegata TaxID=167791 RepID=A0ACB9NKV5_BAUVA|nr:hypothetical protein L6164_015532 [Bauhinia variegata]
MVKKHSILLEKTIVDEKYASDVEMDMRFWHDVFDWTQGDAKIMISYFLSENWCSSHDYGSSNNTESTAPYFVRRWPPKLDNLIDETSVDMDWRRSFYLNLIAHASFSVTVAICRQCYDFLHQSLQNHQAGHNAPLSPIYKVVKTVYASPGRVNFQLDSTKAMETTSAYPDICFAVDDFDSTFHAVVLTEKDHYYCVVLNAHDGAAFPRENDSSISDNPPLNPDTEGY